MAELEVLALAILEELCAQHPLGYRPLITWRNLRVSAGIAYYRQGRISLSRLLLNDAERLRTTLVHEYAHLLAYKRSALHGRAHGPVWQQAMRDLGASPVVRHEYPVERNRPRQAVLYRCRTCGAEFVRARRLPQRRKYLHARCGGPIEFLAVTAAVSDA